MLTFKMKKILPGCLIFFLLAGRVSVRSAEPPLAEFQRLVGPPRGLVVVVGAEDPRFAAELVRPGVVLYHGLTATESATHRLRAGLLADGVYGLASVAHWPDVSRLPYADRLVDVLVVDQISPPASEIRRVLAPGGYLVRRNQGRWEAVSVPRPATLGTWAHFDHGADGNVLSSDLESGPIRQLQWSSTRMPVLESGNAAGYNPGIGLRVGERYMVQHIQLPGTAGRGPVWAMQVRDAWNGLPIWSKALPERMSPQEPTLVAIGNTLLFWPELDGELAAFDLSTGTELRRYSGTQRSLVGYKRAWSINHDAMIRVTGNHLVVSIENRIMAFDLDTATRRWTLNREGKLLLGTVVDEAEGRVYTLVSGAGDRVYWGRWPSTVHCEAILGISLSDGSLLWQQTELPTTRTPHEDPRKPETIGRTRPRGVGQLLPMGDKLIAFNSAAIIGGEVPMIATLDAATGEVRFVDDQPFKREYNVSAYNVLARDGKAWFAGAFSRIWRYDPETGVTEQVLNYPFNQRCIRFTATPNWLLFGQSGFFREDLTGEQAFVARSGCAMGAIPANGLVYYSPNSCKCITQTAALQAFSPSERTISPVGQQLFLRGKGSPVPEFPAPPEVLPEGPIAKEWLHSHAAKALRGASVDDSVSGLTFTVLPHQHLLVGARDGNRVWSAVADARLSGAPLVVGGLVLCGSHDGTVYAWRVSDGRLVWRRLVAPSLRWVVADGQLESAWPIYGLAMHEGSVIASAGTHAELIGGITVMAMNPLTGDPVWTRTLHKPTTPIGGNMRGMRFADRSVINSAPRVEEGRLVLHDGSAFRGRFNFEIGEEEAAINSRLSTPPTKK